MKRLLDFLQYHNAIPIALGILMLGAGATFASTNPDAILSTQQQVISIDNTYIASKDLSAYTPQVQITAVTEDADRYYVSYTFSTVDVQDSVWRDVTKNQTLTVARSVLGQYGDLGVYVTEQLKQNIDHEIDRLKEVQAMEKPHVTQKTVAIAYGGLIGKMLDGTTETLPGYTPVVVAPPPPPPQVAAAASGVPSAPQSQTSQTPTSQQPLTQSQIEDLIRQQVQEILASQGVSPSQLRGGSGGGGSDGSDTSTSTTSTRTVIVDAQAQTNTEVATSSATSTRSIDTGTGTTTSP